MASRELLLSIEAQNVRSIYYNCVSSGSRGGIVRQKFHLPNKSIEPFFGYFPNIFANGGKSREKSREKMTWPCFVAELLLKFCFTT